MEKIKTKMSLRKERNRSTGSWKESPFVKRQSAMPTQRPKTTEPVHANGTDSYTYLVERFSATLSLKNGVKQKTSTTEENAPDCEDFLLKILGWDPAWLSQKRRNSGIPASVADEKSINPIPLKFTHHRDYRDIMEPLLALEFWEQISRALDVETKDRTQAPIKCARTSFRDDWTEETRTHHPRSRCRRLTLEVEAVVSREDFDAQNYPDYGDLVLVKQKKSSSRTEKPLKIFAYVEEMETTVLEQTARTKMLYQRYVEKPHVVLTYSLYMKSAYIRSMGASGIFTLQKIFCIRSSLRMIQALRYLPHSSVGHQILHPKFEDLKLSEISRSEPQSLVTQDQLNSRQLEAVIHVTDAADRQLRKICLIQGPPGTGKSKVIVNLVTEIIYGGNRKTRILVCAPSNTAVDEIVRRLLDIRERISKPKESLKVVRMGRIKSMDSQVAKEVSLDTLVRKKLAAIRDDYEKKRRPIQATIKAQQVGLKEARDRGDDNVVELSILLRKTESQLNDLLTEERIILDELQRDKHAEISVLTEADVIACTLNSCYTSLMESTFGGEKGETASFCIVDEATQCMEVECLIPLMLGVRTLVLVGDTNQLPATVISQRAKKLGLDQSLFARIQKCFPSKEENPVIQLDTQYRMSVPVALWPNLFFYDGLLQNAAIVQDLPFLYYKVFDHDAKQNKDKFSNTDEAAFVVNVLYSLMVYSQLNEAKTPVRVGIITPYNNQKKLLNDQIWKRIHALPETLQSKLTYEVNTVDGFQGQERDIIIMSCVRSNGIGFLSDRHRLCVALTRAKHSVILCGNFKTFESNSMWKALLSDAKKREVYMKIKATARPSEIKQHVFQ